MSINASNNPYPDSPDASPTKLDKGGYDGTAETLDNKIDEILAEAKLLINNTLVGSVSIGSIVPSSVPPATGAVHAFATQAGTYTNWGGFVIPANTFALISRSSNLVFSISQTALDVSGKVNVSDVINTLASTETAKPLSANQGRVLDLKIAQGIVNWTAKAFLINDEVSHLGKLWQANAAIVSTDVPGTSSKWVEVLSGYSKADNDIKTSFYNIVWSNGYLNKAIGYLGQEPNHFNTDFIEIVAEKKYLTNVYCLGNAAIIYYDVNKVFLSSVNCNGSFNVAGTFIIPPVNAVYVRLSNVETVTARTNFFFYPEDLSFPFPNKKYVDTLVATKVNTVVTDNLTSTSATNALSANQGRVLDLKIAQGIVNWTAKAFLINDEVSHLGKLWQANAAIVSTDVPGTSSKWVEVLSGYSKADNDIKTSFYNIVWSNGYLSKSIGLLQQEPNHFNTDFIEIVAEKKYLTNVYCLGNAAIIYYDVNKIFLSSVNCNGSFNVAGTFIIPPANAFYVRLSNVETVTPRANIFFYAEDLSFPFANKNYTKTEIDKKVNTSFNLVRQIPYNTTWSTGYLFKTTGQLVASVDHYNTDFIEIFSLNKYLTNINALGNAGIIYYNESKVYLSGENSNGTHIIPPAGAYYVRLTNTIAGTPQANVFFYLEDLKFPYTTKGYVDSKIAQGIVNWTAKAFLINDEVSHLGKLWQANAAIVSTDVPGTSSKWVEVLSGYSKADNDIKTSFYNIVWSNGYLNKAIGLLQQEPNHFNTDFIEIVAEKKYLTNVYCLGNAAIIYYDVNKVFLSSVNCNGSFNVAGTFIIPPVNAVYVRLSNVETVTPRSNFLFYAEDLSFPFANKKYVDTKIDEKIISLPTTKTTVELSDFTLVSGVVGQASAVYNYDFNKLPASGYVEMEIEDVADFNEQVIEMPFRIKSGATNQLRLIKESSGYLPGAYSNKYDTNMKFVVGNATFTTNTIALNNNIYGSPLFTIRLKYPVNSVNDNWDLTTATAMPVNYQDLVMTINAVGLYIYRSSLGIGSPIYSYVFPVGGKVYDLVTDMKNSPLLVDFEILDANSKSALLTQIEKMSLVSMVRNTPEFVWDGSVPLKPNYWDAFPVTVKSNSIGRKHTIKISWKIENSFFMKIKISIDNLCFKQYTATGTIIDTGTSPFKTMELSGTTYKVNKFFYKPEYLEQNNLYVSYHHGIADSEEELSVLVPGAGTNSTARLKRMYKHLSENGYTYINNDDLEDIINGRIDMPQKCFMPQYDDYVRFIYSTKIYRDIFIKAGARPVMAYLPEKGLYLGGFSDADSRIVKTTDLFPMRNYGYTLTFHGLNISDGGKKTLIGYKQYQKFIDIGFAAFEKIGAALKVYTPHMSEAVTTHQRDLLYKNGVQRIVGDGWPNVYTLATDLNIPESYDICGSCIGMDISIRRHYLANTDLNYQSTTELGWERFLRDLDKTV